MSTKYKLLSGFEIDLEAGVDNSIQVVNIVYDRNLPPDRQSEASITAFKKAMNVLPGSVHPPVAQFKLIDEYEWPTRFDRGAEYYKLPEPSIRERQICYEADDQDFFWLEMLNEERTTDKKHVVHLDDFERVMDQLEKKSFIKAISTRHEDFCDVCLDPYAYDGNEILFCDLCNISFHQGCYGVPILLEGSYFCRNCEVSPTTPLVCSLCPVTGGLLKATAGNKNRWAHVLCTKFVSETYFEAPAFMDNILGIEDALKVSEKKICYLCGMKGVGACVKCSSKKCKKTFHVMCARIAGLKLDEAQEENDRSITMCHLHMSDPDCRGPKAKKNKMEEAVKSVREFIEKQQKTGAGSVRILPSELQSIQEEVGFPIDDIAEYWQMRRKKRNGAMLDRRFSMKIVSAEEPASDAAVEVPHEELPLEEETLVEDILEEEAPEKELRPQVEAIALQEKKSKKNVAVVLENDEMDEESDENDDSLMEDEVKEQEMLLKEVSDEQPERFEVMGSKPEDVTENSPQMKEILMMEEDTFVAEILNDEEAPEKEEDIIRINDPKQCTGIVLEEEMPLGDERLHEEEEALEEHPEGIEDIDSREDNTSFITESFDEEYLSGDDELRQKKEVDPFEEGLSDEEILKEEEESRRLIDTVVVPKNEVMEEVPAGLEDDEEEEEMEHEELLKEVEVSKEQSEGIEDDIIPKKIDFLEVSLADDVEEQKESDVDLPEPEESSTDRQEAIDTESKTESIPIYGLETVVCDIPEATILEVANNLVKIPRADDPAKDESLVQKDDDPQEKEDAEQEVQFVLKQLSKKTTSLISSSCSQPEDSILKKEVVIEEHGAFGDQDAATDSEEALLKPKEAFLAGYAATEEVTPRIDASHKEEDVELEKSEDPKEIDRPEALVAEEAKKGDVGELHAKQLQKEFDTEIIPNGGLKPVFSDIPEESAENTKKIPQLEDPTKGMPVEEEDELPEEESEELKADYDPISGSDAVSEDQDETAVYSVASDDVSGDLAASTEPDDVMKKEEVVKGMVPNPESSPGPLEEEDSLNSPATAPKPKTLSDLQKELKTMRSDLDKMRMLAFLVQKRELKKVEFVSVSAKIFQEFLSPMPIVLENVVKELFEKDIEMVFHEPVDCDGYSDDIKNPMDLSTMLAKVESGEIDSFETLRAAFDLMIDNCLMFNKPRSFIARYGTNFRKYGNVIILEAEEKQKQIDEMLGEEGSVSMLFDFEKDGGSGKVTEGTSTGKDEAAARKRKPQGGGFFPIPHKKEKLDEDGEGSSTRP